MKKSIFIAGVLSLCMMTFHSYAEGWDKEGNVWRYLDEKGNPMTHQWIEEGSEWYYIDKKGEMATGWKKIGNSTYYFDENTGALAKGWKTSENGRSFYYTNEGNMQRGWLSDHGNWYWFDEKGQMLRNSWKTIDGDTYYFTEDGSMAANEFAGLYYMDVNGHLDKSKSLKIALRGRVTESEEKALKRSLEKIPGGWLKDFSQKGFWIEYNTEKSYISKKTLDDGGIYYKDYSLDNGARRVRVSSPEGVLRGMGEYIGYRSGALKGESEFRSDWGFYGDALEDLFRFPQDFENDEKLYFAETVAWYLENAESRKELQDAAPNLCDVLDEILYPDKVREDKGETIKQTPGQTPSSVRYK